MSCALLATGWQISNSFCLFCRSALQQLCSLQSHTSVAIGTYVPTHILWRPTDLWRQEDTMTAPYFFPGFLALPQIRFLLKLTFSCSQSTSPFLCETLACFMRRFFHLLCLLMCLYLIAYWYVFAYVLYTFCMFGYVLVFCILKIFVNCLESTVQWRNALRNLHYY